LVYKQSKNYERTNLFIMQYNNPQLDPSKTNLLL